MPPCLDIYVLSPRRDPETIARFLSEYGHSWANEDRRGEELSLLPLGVEREPTSADEYESEPISTLQEAIARGLSVPYRAFCLYLKSGDESIYRVILAFRTDGSVVFGLSVDDPYDGDSIVDEAKRLLLHVAEAYGGVAGFVACEVPPPLLGETFPTANEEPVVYSWHRQAA